MYPEPDRGVKLRADLARLPQEERLLLLCARTVASADVAAEVERALSRDVDWRRLIEVGWQQAVFPLAAGQLLTTYRDRVPAVGRGPLEREARIGAGDSLAMTRLLLELLRAFERARVDVLPFKGPTLALQAYGDPGLRTFGDLDLLVRPTDLAAARAILLALGCAPSYPTTPARRALLVRRGSHETFGRGGSTIELHWRIAAGVSDFDLDYDRLWRRRIRLTVGDRAVPALRPEDLLLVLAVHGTKHAWERLAWICDVAELLRAHPGLDWGELVREAERMRLGRALRLALALADELLDAPLPTDLCDAVRRDPAVQSLVAHVREGLFLPPRAGAGTFGFHLRTRPGTRAKLALAFGSLTALNQRDLEIVSLPDAALPLYYLTRPARLVAKALLHAAGVRRR